MTAMQARYDLPSWLHTWDISMQHVRFSSVTDREKSHYCIGVYLESYREAGLLEDMWVLQFDHMRA